jgi:DNA-binding MarR family transcriptional regulator
MSLKTTLFALSNILDAAENRSGLGDMDPESRAILKYVGACTGAGQEVCIKDITHNPQMHSSAVTLVKRIQSLCEAGWLVQGTSAVHHRRVTLSLTPKARRELNAVSSCIEAELSQLLGRET